MEVKFIKTNPTQNMTILVESLHTREMYNRMASSMMAYDHVFAEQVGFIESSESDTAWARLQMMAGEFCGNATMSLAAVMAWKKNLQPGNRLEVPLEVSGTNELLVCEVTAQQTGYLCKLDMPLPLSIHKKTINYRDVNVPTTIIRYQGIVHAVVHVPNFDSYSREMAQIIVKSPELLQGEAASGVMLYRRQSNEIEPLVYIPDTDTMIWERGCGSGTASLGACVAHEIQRDIHMEIKQPGGMIEVWAHYQEDQMTGLAIQGHVDISAVGTAFV
ncbi:diaminopimelate epimerase [Paenibacillus sp. V4I5]|uniref:diaminopimelate epimerase n=1 Tax=Paenibacillus sp. V4I5 TaxID=3042306 RepID=UPI00278EC289|nr:diaminopimelate epimerase [Paenibacillus sp. V4I5]MDQ0920323.1 diaminopimelate epimerase [Paenibacillus sp. V4I5]